MLIPSVTPSADASAPSLSRRVNANSQPYIDELGEMLKLIKKGEC